MLSMFRIVARPVSVGVLLSVPMTSALAQVSVPNSPGTITIDFDNTVSGVNNGQYAGTGFEPTPVSGRLDSDAFSLNIESGTMAFGGTQTSGAFAGGVSSGGSSVTGLQAFTVASGNRAFGVQPTGSSFTPGNVTLRIKNDASNPITGFKISYKVYVFNDQARSNSFNFSRSANNTSYTNEPSLDFASPATASGSPAWVSTDRSITLSGLTVAAGGFYYLRWTGDDVSGSGNRDEFGLDDITFENFTFGSPPATVTWNVAGGGDWDTTSNNWIDGSPDANKYKGGDTAVFGGTFVGTRSINVTLAGANPTETRVQNTSGTYEFTGGAIGGDGAIVKSGGGTLLISNSNVYGGGTQVNGGTVSVAADAALGASTGDVSLNGGALLVTESITVGTGRDIAIGASGGTLAIAASKTLTLQGNVDAAANVLNVDAVGDVSLGNGGSTDLIGTGQVVKRGAGRLTLNIDSDYDGVLVINAGTAQFGTAGIIGSTGDVTVAGGWLDAGTTGEGFDVFTLSSGTYTAQSGGSITPLSIVAESGVIAGPITGSGPMVKNTSGVVTITSSNTHSGATTINAGQLLINGSTASPQTVKTGATLGGTGATTGSVVVESGGTLSPGSGGIEDLSIGALTLQDGANYLVEIDTTAGSVTSGDRTNVTGAVTLGAGTSPNLVFSFSPVVLGGVVTPNPIVIVQNDGSDPVTGQFAGLTPNGSGVATFDNGILKYTLYYKFNNPGDLTGGNDIAVSFTEVPEPSSLAVAALGLIGLTRRRR